MEHPSEFDNCSSVTAGIYRQNTFSIWMASEFDLDPSEGEPTPFATAMQAHEYVHFLHNASTTAGQAYLLSNLIFLRALASGCDDRGYFLGVDCMTKEQRDWSHISGTLMRVQLGTTSASQLTGCKKVGDWECGPPEISIVDGIRTVGTVFKAQNATGNIQSQSVTIGLSFITEGVAYEVDREMRRLGGMLEHNLDKDTEVFPYLAYRLLVKNWSGRKLSVHDCIAVGVCALGHRYAGYCLETICLALKNTKLTVDEVLKNARSNCHAESERMLALLREQRRDLSAGDTIWSAMGEYLELVEAGAQLRRRNWVPELEFLSHKLTPDELRKCFGSMLDCQIRQRKPDGEMEIYWIGPGHVARTDETGMCLGALQSALHFSQLHLNTKGSANPTAALRNRTIQCPFAGGCKVERDDQYPVVCTSAPWERFVDSRSREKVCWYAAGVKALRNSAVHGSLPVD